MSVFIVVQIKLYGLIKHRLTLFFYIKKSSSGPEANAVVEEEKEKVPSSSELCKLSCLSSNLTWAYLIFFLLKRDLVAQMKPMRWWRNRRYTIRKSRYGLCLELYKISYLHYSN